MSSSYKIIEKLGINDQGSDIINHILLNLRVNETYDLRKVSKNINKLVSNNINKRRLRYQKTQWSIIHPNMSDNYEENEKIINVYGAKTFEFEDGEEEVWNQAINSIKNHPASLTNEERESIEKRMLPLHYEYYTLPRKILPNITFPYSGGVIKGMENINQNAMNCYNMFRVGSRMLQPVSTMSIAAILSADFKTVLQILAIDDHRNRDASLVYQSLLRWYNKDNPKNLAIMCIISLMFSRLGSEFILNKTWCNSAVAKMIVKDDFVLTNNILGFISNSTREMLIGLHQKGQHLFDRDVGSKEIFKILVEKMSSTQFRNNSTAINRMANLGIISNSEHSSRYNELLYSGMKLLIEKFPRTSLGSRIKEFVRHMEVVPSDEDY